MAMFESTDDRTRALPRVTVEVALYAALALGALCLRIIGLGDAPLTSAEARQALASWNFVNGKADAFIGSPLLFTANALLFALFGANDALARLVPALAGTALVLVPALWRRELGRLGALVTSALLVVSPSLVFFSRTLDGALLAVTCALISLAFASRYLAERAAREANLAAIFAALAFTAAREVWTIVLALALWLIISRLTFSRFTFHVPRTMQHAILFFGVTLLLTATAFTLRREGLGATFDLFGAWLAGLRPSAAFYDPLRLLVIYEPLVFLFGLLALIRLSFVEVDERARTFFNILTFWIVVAFVAYTIGADKNPARVVVIVVPLTMIAGWFIGDWLERAARETDVEFFIAQEIPVMIFACVIGAFLYLIVVELATRGTLAITAVLARVFGWERIPGAMPDVQVVVALILIALVAVAFLIVATVGRARARTLALALVLIGLSVWTVRQTAMLNYDAMRNAREYLVARAAAANVRDLERDLRDVSRWRANDSITLHVVADEKTGSLVAWVLRDFPNARLAARPLAAQALLLPAPAPAPSSDWTGQTYTLEVQRAPKTAWGWLEWLRWLLFRDVGALERVSVELWMRQAE
jgi:uncharacterized protein (TIGR03663 family)